MLIRLLYVIDRLGVGGTERQLVELLQGLDRTRVLPHLCTLKPSQVASHKINVPTLNLEFQTFSSLRLIPALARLSRFVSEHGINLTHTFFQDPFLLAALLKPICRYGLVGSFRDLGFWRTPLESRKMRLAYPFFDGFVANSRAVADHFIATDRIPPEKIEVIHNGFNFSALERTPAVSLPSADRPIVGIVANLNRPVKRVEDFLRAAALVHSQRPHARYVVVGSGHLQSDMCRLSTALGLGESIRFAGHADDPLKHVRAFSVGVITSETEGFCNAILEYMACGVPVVASDAGGNPEMIEDGVNGFLVPTGHPEKFADRICRLLDDERMSSEMGSRNRAKIRERFDIGRMLDSHSRYYEKIVASAMMP